MEIRFSNKNIPEVQKKLGSIYVKGNFSEGRQPIEGEYKTSFERQLITNVNFAMSREFEEMGLSDRFQEMDPDSVHILDGKTYNEHFRDDESRAQVVKRDHALFVNRDSMENEAFYTFVFLHESVHYFSNTVFRYLPHNTAAYPARGGYSISTLWPRKVLFSGFDEAVVDESAIHIQEKYFHLFFGPNADQDNTMRVFGMYEREGEILRSIIEGVSKHKKEDPEATWMRFYKAEFTGDVSPFRDIESAFGSGSLRILSPLGQEYQHSNFPEKEAEENIRRAKAHFVRD